MAIKSMTIGGEEKGDKMDKTKMWVVTKDGRYVRADMIEGVYQTFLTEVGKTWGPESYSGIDKRQLYITVGGKDHPFTGYIHWSQTTGALEIFEHVRREDPDWVYKPEYMVITLEDEEIPGVCDRCGDENPLTAHYENDWICEQCFERR